MWEWLTRLIFLFYLGCGAISDIRSRRVSRLWVVTGGVLAMSKIVIEWILFENVDWLDISIGVLIGGIFLLISRLGKESIGYGDSITFATMGGYFGSQAMIMYMILAFLFVNIYVVYLKLRGKAIRNRTVAFLPFLFVACLGGMMIES